MAPAMMAAATAELVAVAGHERAGAAAFAARHGARRTHADAQALIADPEVDAVYVATPVDSHASLTVAALEAGKAVLVEKPMARTVAESEAMVDAARRTGRPLLVCFYQRINPRHREARRLVETGAIGRPTAARVAFSGRSRPRPGAWRFDPRRAGGGVFADQGSHAVDLLRYVLADDVETAAALSDTLAEPAAVEDTATALLRFTRGTHAVVTAHWSIEDPSPQRTSVLEVSGTEGTLVTWPLHDKFSRGSLVLATADGEREIPTTEQSTHAALLDAFAAALATGDWPPELATGADGHAAMRVQEAVYEAARRGATIRL
jgi:1,5-anhydro-D-fructose reductase (1,5-anhydro-D-mannitol-forming)